MTDSRIKRATLAMHSDSLFRFDLPAAGRKKVTAAFDGGSISSDGGLVLLREAERRLGLSALLAKCIRDRRDPARITHQLAEMVRFRMLAIACGNEDADDCDALRCDPLFNCRNHAGYRRHLRPGPWATADVAVPRSL